MGKTPKPLRFLIDQDIAHWPEWEELRAQGHKITCGIPSDYDLVMGPTCWRLTEWHRPYLEAAIKAMREQKYPRKGKSS